MFNGHFSSIATVLYLLTVSVYQFTFYWVVTSVATCCSPISSVRCTIYPPRSLTNQNLLFTLFLVSYLLNLSLPLVLSGDRSETSVAPAAPQWQQDKSPNVCIITQLLYPLPFAIQRYYWRVHRGIVVQLQQCQLECGSCQHWPPRIRKEDWYVFSPLVGQKFVLSFPWKVLEKVLYVR